MRKMLNTTQSKKTNRPKLQEAVWEQKDSEVDISLYQLLFWTGGLLVVAAILTEIGT